MIVKKYKATVASIVNEIEGVYTLGFVLETGKFKFLPGQFLHIAIDENYDGSGQWPESRCFSLQTSPSERMAKITYAVKGEFTKKMEEYLKIGSEVWLKLPYGELFEQEHNLKHTVFISGGTGITPFLSLFTDSSFIQYECPILYAGYKNASFNFYHRELEVAKQINANFKINPVYQDLEGVLNIDSIFQQNLKDASYFISGPPVMIKLFKSKLLEKGVSESNILTDDWE